MILIADPLILLAPNQYSSQEAWVNYFSFLQECSDLLIDEIYKVSFSSISVDALYTSDRFPQSINQLQTWLTGDGVFDGDDFFDAKTLFSLQNTLLNQPSLEEHLDISVEYDKEEPDVAIWITESDHSVLIQKDKISIDPRNLIARYYDSPAIANAFQMTVGILTYAMKYRKTSGRSSDEFAILTIEDNDLTRFLKVSVDAVISAQEDTLHTVSFDLYLSPRTIKEAVSDQEIISRYWPDIEAIFGQFLLRYNYDFPLYKFSKGIVKQLTQEKSNLTFYFRRFLDLLISHIDNASAVSIDGKNNHKLINIEDDGVWEPYRLYITRDTDRLHYWVIKSKKIFMFSKIVKDHDDYTIVPNRKEKEELLGSLDD